MKLKAKDTVLVKAKVVYINSEGGVDLEIEDSYRVKHIVYDVDPGDIGRLEIEE